MIWQKRQKVGVVWKCSFGLRWITVVSLTFGAWSNSWNLTQSFTCCLHLFYPVYTFASRCLEPLRKYLLWHTEDCFGLRGRKFQLTLQENIAGIRHLTIYHNISLFIRQYLHPRSLHLCRCARLPTKTCSICISITSPPAVWKVYNLKDKYN